jgi:hypothetical protein
MGVGPRGALADTEGTAASAGRKASGCRGRRRSAPTPLSSVSDCQRCGVPSALGRSACEWTYDYAGHLLDGNEPNGTAPGITLSINLPAPLGPNLTGDVSSQVLPNGFAFTGQPNGTITIAQDRSQTPRPSAIHRSPSIDQRTVTAI